MRYPLDWNPEDGRTPAVFFDLDSTVCDTTHRHDLIDRSEGGKTDWVAYSMACSKDEPIPGAVELVRTMKALGVHIVLLSGRSEMSAGMTREWLEEHGIPYDDLLLRPNSSRAKNEDYKIERLRVWASQNPDYRISLLVDDWAPVKAAVEGVLGIPVLVVTPPHELALERELL